MAKATHTGLRVRKKADRSEGDRRTMLVARTDQVHIEDDRVVIDPTVLQTILVNPDTPGYDHEPWPLAGLEIVGDPPKRCRVATGWVQRGKAEGWLELVGEKVEHAPGGPDEDPWRVTHTFVTAKALVLQTVDGNVRYEIVSNPGKYDDTDEPSGTRVDWFYDLKLAG